MKKILLIPAFIVSIFLFQGCENDDLTQPGGNKDVKSTFETMYPDATHVEWEKKGNYWVADFWKDSKEMEAWFSTSGEWYQTETDLTFTTLPEAVKTAFQSGEYKNWRIEDINLFERKDSDNFYVLDVENGNQDYDLYYSPEGTMIKAVADNS